MFSVIIPLYNKAPYIEKAIRSVVAQTFQEFELIIVDDGSTDDGLLIANNLLSSLFPPLEGQGANPLGGWGLVGQENQGVSTARNNGVKQAKYDLIAFLDADDWWAPNYLEEMKSLIEQFPEAGIYGSSYFIVKNGRNQISTIGVESNFKVGIINYFQVYAKTLAMPLWTGATIIKKSIFIEEKGFKPLIKLGEDFDLWIRVALKYPVAFLNKPLAFYNQDVELKNRAVGKLQNPATHILWDLDYLKEEEKQNRDFKQLLDNLRTYSLLPYYISNQYHTVAELELKKVDWKNQSQKIVQIYNTPRILVKCQNKFMEIGSKLKQWLLNVDLLLKKNK